MSAHTAPLILAIDLGTTACKIGLVTPNGKVVAYTQESDATPTHFLPGGGAEQDPSDWWKVVTATTRRLLRETNTPREQVVAVSASVHWSGTVAVNQEGKPLGNAIIWMDTRGAPYIKEITGGVVKIDGYGPDKILTWVRLTGGIPTHSGKDPVAHILFIKNKHPEIYKAAYKFLEPKDYMNFLLTGEMASDYSTIALHWVTDNRDINNVRYDPKLLKMAGIDREKLPDLYPTTHILGKLLPEAAEAMDLPAGLPVSMGAPDVQAPTLGSGAVGDFEPHIYVGTSSWLSCHVPFKKSDLFHNMASLPSAIPGRYFVANEQETSGVSLTFLRDKFFFADDDLGTGRPPDNAYQLFDRMAAEAPPGSHGVIFTPWLYGERTPVDDPTLRGGFYNLSLQITRADLIRAAFEGVAMNTRWLLKYMEKFVHRRFGPINIIGGGGISDVWCQIFADVLNRPIRQIKDPQAAGLRGVGVIAGLALDLTTLEDYARYVEIQQTFSPNPDNRAMYDGLFDAFTDIYKRNRSLYRKLNRFSK